MKGSKIALLIVTALTLRLQYHQVTSNESQGRKVHNCNDK